MLIKEEVKNKEKRAKKRKYETLIKNQFKKTETYVKEKKTDEKELKKLLSETQKVLDKAQNKKVIHKNKAARKKSQLYNRLNDLLKQSDREI
jgi:small subunit ribosomal protein S20